LTNGIYIGDEATTGDRGRFHKACKRKEVSLLYRTKISALSILLIAAFVLSAAMNPAAAESAWEQVKRTGKLRYGAIEYPPYWYRDKTTGKWTGAVVEMAEDVAKEINVEPVAVETTWASCVLDLQSNKIDLQFGLQATPKRALAIDFAGPAYHLGWYMINHRGFKASTWEDYNKPEVKIAGILGTSDIVILQKMAPKATRIELPQIADIALAVTSGRADAMVSAVIGALVAKARNPELGDFVQPTPYVALPSYIGVRREDNETFRKFLQAWAEWNELLGYTDERMKRHLASAGATGVPENVHF
jgi:polar amino acid transport system substrate-binding protein